MQSSKFSLSVKAAALSMALALGGVAYAANPVSSATTAAPMQENAAAEQSRSSSYAHKKGDHHRHHRAMHRHGRDVAMWVPGFGPLGKEFVDSLALTADQTKLLDAAQTQQKAGAKARRTAMKSMHSAKVDQIKAGQIDPHAALRQADEIRQKGAAQRKQLDEKWIAVWDALDTTQQGKIAAYLSGRADKLSQRMNGHKHHTRGAIAEKAAS